MPQDPLSDEEPQSMLVYKKDEPVKSVFVDDNNKNFFE
jgi:hypothetical protein